MLNSEYELYIKIVKYSMHSANSTYCVFTIELSVQSFHTNYAPLSCMSWRCVCILVCAIYILTFSAFLVCKKMC